MRKLGVVLLSGGLDSTTVAAQARAMGFDLFALTLRYGQTHQKEIECAAAVARRLSLHHRTVDVSFFKTLAWYSALTSPQSFQTPHSRDLKEISQGVPITYVPLRNTFFLTLAASLLESELLDLVEGRGVPPSQLRGVIFIAANALDYSGYPDCRPEFYRAMAEVFRLGSKVGTQYGVSIAVETPLIDKTKAQIVKLAMELGAPLELTWSCYEGGTVPCGVCDSCILRAKGFRQAGYEDPLSRGLKVRGRDAEG